MIEKMSALPRWLRFSLLALFSALLVVWLLARFWLPEFARQKGEQVLSGILHRPVSIGAIDISPFSLGIGVSRMSIAQRNAVAGEAPLFSFERFDLNLSVASLWYAAPVVSSVRLVGPQLALVRETEDRLNISDLLESPPKDENVADKKPAGIPDFSLANVEISGGQIVFDDRQKKTRHVVSELSLGIPFAGTLGTQEETWVEPHFHARLNGALFDLKGKVKPFTDRREATLEIRLQDLDVRPLAAYAPLGELKVLSARLDVDLDLRFVQTPGKPFSLLVKGDSALRQLAIENRGGAPYVVSADRLAVKLVELDASLKKPIKASLSLDQLALRAGASPAAKSSGEHLLLLPKLTISDAEIDLRAKRVDVSAIALEGLHLALRREKDGRIDLARVLVPPGKPEDLQKKSANATLKAGASAPDASGASVGTVASNAASTKAGVKDAPAWQGTIGSFAVNNAGLRFADQTVDKAPPLLVEGLTLAINKIDLTGATPASVSVGATVNQRGRLAFNGTAAWAPVAVEMKIAVSELDLVPLQGWAGGKLNAVLSRGSLNIGGTLGLAGDPLVARFDGDGRLANVNLFDHQHTADILNFKAIDLAGLRFVSAPLAVNLQRLTIDEFFARAILGADGKINFSQLVKRDAPPVSPVEPDSRNSPSAETASLPPAAATVGAESSVKAALPVSIGEIVIKKSRIDFTDRFVKPPYSANLSGLEGKISSLGAGKRGLIDLRGAVDRSAPLAISGEVDPFDSALFLNIAARVKGIDMPAMSPYAERYLGYELSKGKLSFDAKYFVENNQLKAENHLFLDQLTFGNRVESPEALSVPVTLAVALLKNARGEIDLDLPLSGALNDPEFSVARIIFKVLGNLIVKAVSSPFALLGSLFSGGEELSQVDYAAGRANLDAESEKRLSGLAKALLDRPALTLEITGFADPERDRSALATSLLERRLRARKLAENAQKGQESSALRQVVLSPEERMKGLVELAQVDGLAVAKGASAAAYETALLAGIKVGNDELRQLAERRGRGVRNWLVDRGKVPVERVFVMVPKVLAADGSLAPGKAAFSLR